MEIVRARWSSSSFLLYAGALVVLAAAVALLGSLSEDYGEGAFFGWSALVLAAVTALTVAFDRAGKRVTAGLFAFVSVGVFAVFAGSFLDLIGLDFGEGPFDGFVVGRLLLYLLTAVAAFTLLGRYHFPLLVLAGAFAMWLFALDLVSGGGDWTAVVAIVVGLFYLALGSAVEPAYGFWLHALAGLSIGGGVLYLWHEADWEWIIVGVVALLFVAVAGALERSSYAVFGAIGLFLAWSHFVEEWLDDSPVEPFIGPLGSGGDSALQAGGVELWERALLYGLYGLVLVALGLWLERRRRALSPPETPAA